jgi:hypothetical protein
MLTGSRLATPRMSVPAAPNAGSRTPPAFLARKPTALPPCRLLVFVYRQGVESKLG